MDTIEISLKIDRLPIFKVFILSQFKVFQNTLTFGARMPANLDFLQDRVWDLAVVLRSGVEHNSKKYKIQLRSIVSDAPAWPLVKCVNQYSGNFGCERHTPKGV